MYTYVSISLHVNCIWSEGINPVDLQWKISTDNLRCKQT